MTRAALENRIIRAVVLAFGFVTLGEWVVGATVAVRAYAVGGALAVGLVGFRFAPAALAGSWTTRLADHRQRQRVLTLTAATRATATGAAAAALALGLPFGIVIALVWLDAAAGSAYRPAQAALLPSLVRAPGELTAATALASNAKSFGQIVGAVLGGVLAATAPVAVAVGAAALLHLLASALTARGFGASGAAVRTEHGRGGLRALLNGIGFLRRDRDAGAIVVYSCLRSLVRGLWLALAVVASLRLLGLGKSGLGDLMAAAAVGAVLAIFATTLLVGHRRLAGWFALGLILCGLPIVATALAAGAIPAIAFMVVWGLGMSLSDVGAQTLLNRIVPSRWIGRVTGAMEAAKLLCEGIGSLVAPALLLVVGVRGALLVAGGLVPVVVVLGRVAFTRIDDRAVGRIELLELLRRVPFFDPLRVDALEGIASRLTVERHSAGAEVVREGDPDGHRWYLVEAGEMTVEIDRFVVGKIARGGQFGERSLLRGGPRAATVRAHTDVVLYALGRDDFLAAVAGFQLEDALSGDLLAPASRISPSTALERAPLLHHLGAAERAHLSEHSRVREVPAGKAIVLKGEEDDVYFVLLDGRAHVVLDGEEPRQLLPGDAFGEIAVLYRVPRRASVIAREDATVLAIDGDAIRGVLNADGAAVAALTA